MKYWPPAEQHLQPGKFCLIYMKGWWSPPAGLCSAGAHSSNVAKTCNTFCQNHFLLNYILTNVNVQGLKDSSTTWKMMDDEEALKESVSNLRSAILLGRTDIIRSILSTAAECKLRKLFFFPSTCLVALKLSVLYFSAAWIWLKTFKTT